MGVMYIYGVFFKTFCSSGYLWWCFVGNIRGFKTVVMNFAQSIETEAGSAWVKLLSTKKATFLG